jgi:hypothetical protein
MGRPRRRRFQPRENLDGREIEIHRPQEVKEDLGIDAQTPNREHGTPYRDVLNYKCPEGGFHDMHPGFKPGQQKAQSDKSRHHAGYVEISE